jgi:hypothetical protein
MIGRRELVKKALQHTGENGPFKEFARRCQTEQTNNRTLFSVLRAVLRAAPNDSLDSCRATLDIVREKGVGVDDAGNDTKKFEGVNLLHLCKLIGFIFCEGDKILPDTETGFQGYQEEDLIAYLEICRRYFFVAQNKVKEAATLGRTSASGSGSEKNAITLAWEKALKKKNEKAHKSGETS